MSIERHVRRLVVEALGYSRVVFVLGTRQVGKRTLAKQVMAGEHPCGRGCRSGSRRQARCLNLDKCPVGAERRRNEHRGIADDAIEDVRIVVELWRRSSRVDGQTVTSSRVS